MAIDWLLYSANEMNFYLFNTTVISEQKNIAGSPSWPRTYHI